LLKNTGSEPAARVVTKIGPKILGPDGKKAINDLRIFRGIEFFAAGKEFRILVGGASAFFSTKAPTKFTAAITYSDQAGNPYSESITHDLEIYRDLPHTPDFGKIGPE
jgi:hypothetical protein